MTSTEHSSPETAEVRFGFASYKGGKFELIAINIKTGEEITLEGQLRPDQTLEQIDKVLPTCVYVNGVAATAGCICQDQHRRGYCTESGCPYSTDTAAAPSDWKDDPAADERWQAGCDFAMVQLCHAIGVDPKSVRWDAAAETLDGDVNAVIWNILRAKMGDEWDDPHAQAATPREAREALEGVSSWLEGCLSCKTWQWDGLQREAAEKALDKARTALRTPDVAQGEKK